MGKDSGGGAPTTQVIQPSLPSLPNQDTINQQAAGRLGASSPWMNSPWRAIDFFQQQVPALYMPQFTPGALGGGGSGPSGGGGGFQYGSFGNPGGGGWVPAVPGQAPSPGGGGGVPQPTTPIGQQALAQHQLPTMPWMGGMVRNPFVGQMPNPGAPQAPAGWGYADPQNYMSVTYPLAPGWDQQQQAQQSQSQQQPNRGSK